MDTKAKPRQRPRQHRQHQQHQQLQRPLQVQPTTAKPKKTICRACKQKLELANNKVRRTILAHLPSSPPTPPPPPPPMATTTKATACETAAMASIDVGTTTTTCVASPLPSPRTSTAGSSYSYTSSRSFHSTRSSSDRCDSRAGCGNGADYGATGWEHQQQFHQDRRTSFTDEAQTCYNLLLMIRTDTQTLITLRNDNLAELERVSPPADANAKPGTTDGAVEDEDSTRTNSDIDRSLLLAAVNEAITYATRSIAELGPFLERHRWPTSSLYSPGAGGGPGGSPTNPSESTSSRIKILRGRRPKSFFPLSSTSSSAASTYSSTVPTSNPPMSHSRVSSSHGHPQEENGSGETGPLSAAALFSWTLALTDLHSAVLAATAQLRGFVEFGIGALVVSEENRKKHAARTSWWEQDRGEFENVDLIQSLLGPRRPRREIWGGGGGSKTATGGDDSDNKKQETAMAAAAAAVEGDLMVTENQQGEGEEQEKHETPSSSSLPNGHTTTQGKGKTKERDDSAIATLTPVLEVDDSRSETWASPLSAPSTIKSTIADGSDYGLTPRPRTERQGSLQHDSPFAVRRSVTDPLLCFSSSPVREALESTVQVARSETFGQGGGGRGGEVGGSSEQQPPLPLSRFNRPDYSKNPRRRPTISTTMVSTTTSITQQQQQQQNLQYAPLPALNVLQEQLSQALSGVQLASGSGLESINDGESSPLSKGIPHLLTTDNNKNNINTAKPPAPRRISSSPILLSAPLLPNRRNTNSNLNPSPTRRTTEPLPSMATTRPVSSYSPATATPVTPLDPHLLALLAQKALPSKTFQPVIAALDDMIDVAPPVSPLSPLDDEPGKSHLFARQDAATVTTTALTPGNNGNFTTGNTTTGDSTTLKDGREQGSASSTVNRHHKNSPSLSLLRVQPLRPQHQIIQRVSVHPVIEDGSGPPTPDFDNEDRRQSRASSFVPAPQVLVTPAPAPAPAPVSPVDGTEVQTHPPQSQPQPQPLSQTQMQNQPKAYVPFAQHSQQQQRPWSSGAAGPPTGHTTTTTTDSDEHQPFLAYMARKQAVSVARWALDKAQNQVNVPQQQQQ